MCKEPPLRCTIEVPKRRFNYGKRQKDIMLPYGEHYKIHDWLKEKYLETYKGMEHTVRHYQIRTVNPLALAMGI